MQKMLTINFVENLSLTDFDAAAWRTTEKAAINRYWSGADAPATRRATAQMLWTKELLFVRYDCEQHEPLVTNENPQTASETAQLWDNDVCELFLAVDSDAPENYFEFEIAPTGEWLDFKIRQLDDRRETDVNFDAGMKTAVKPNENGFTAIFSVPFSALGKQPEIGAEWRGNFFRCTGAGATRGYLAWQPTKTGNPNFHVPQVFGTFRFVASN